jgi:hypothetical protein
MKKNKLDLKDKIKDHKTFDKKKEIKRKRIKLKLLLFQLKKKTRYEG